MNGINKVVLVATLGKDPECRYTPSGNCVASFSVATSEKWTDKKTGEKQESTEWHNITVFGKLGEVCSEYLKKGSQVYLEGKMKTEKWEDKSGNTRYTTKVICNQMQMLGSKQEGSQSAPTPQQAAPISPDSRGGNSAGGFEPDQDIPFNRLGPEYIA